MSVTISHAAGVVAHMLGAPVVMLLRPSEGDRAEIVHVAGVGRGAPGDQLDFPAQLLAGTGRAPEPLVVTDWLSEPRLPQPPASQRFGVRSSLVVPLPELARSHVLVIEDVVPRTFRNAEVDAVTAVAHLLSAAVARHRQELAQAAVAAFGQFALESRSAEATLQRAVDLATEILDAPVGFVLKVTSTRPGLDDAGGHDPAPSGRPVRVDVLHGRGPLDEPLDGEVMVPAHVAESLRSPGPLPADWPVTASGPAADDPSVTTGVSVGVRVAGQTYRLGVAGTEAGHFSATEVDALQSIAHLMAVALERDRAEAMVRTARSDLQRALLPAALPILDGIEAVARYVPAGHAAGAVLDGADGLGHDRVGGDWYDVLPLPHGGVGLVMGDVEGHDSRAAAVMGQVRNVLRAYVAEGHPPAEVLARVNRFVAAQADLLVTCCYAELHPQDLTVSCVTAGHPVPVVLDRDGTTWSLPARPAPPFGVAPEQDYQERTSLLSPGCCLLLVTDGLVGDAGAIHPGDTAFHVAASALAGVSLDRLADTLVALPPGDPGPRDDAALLVVRLLADHPAEGDAVQRTFAPSPSATRSARRYVTDMLLGWERPDLCDAAELAVSELVTNAVMHTTSSARLVLRRLPAGVWIGVHDTNDRLPVLPRATDELEPGGRGLAIVDLIADRWGITPTPESGGKTVWLELSGPVV